MLVFPRIQKNCCFENVVRILKFGVLGMGGHPFAYGVPMWVVVRGYRGGMGALRTQCKPSTLGQFRYIGLCICVAH